MAEEWTPDRLRALDRAVAEARGWILVGPRHWEDPWGGLWSDDNLPTVSLGCHATLDLKIQGFVALTEGLGPVPKWLIELEGDPLDEPSISGPTIPIAWCLAFLAGEGKEFKG